MKKNFVSNSSGSVRMFGNGFLESLSKVHFYVPLIVFVPVIVRLMWQAIMIEQMPVLVFLEYKHLMLHHYSDSNKGFGVSSDIWDKILGSNFTKK